MMNAFSFVTNRIRQKEAPEVKIFFIGFNRCGTNSFHNLIKKSGVKSVHWLTSDKENIADGIQARLGDLTALRAYLAPWTAFSDLISASATRFVEGNAFFPALHEAFSQSYFVFNDRDVEAWLRSREQHSHGTFIQRAMAYHNASKDEVFNIWRRQHADHSSKVISYFENNPRFIHFRIDRDPIQKIVDFLSPDFKISSSDWGVHKKSASRA